LGFAAYFLNPELIKSEWRGILLIFVMEALCYIISIWKFGKKPVLMLFIKMWGLSLLIAFTYLIGFQHAGWAFYLTIILGFISHIDVILIILFLPKWQYDVPSSISFQMENYYLKIDAFENNLL
jgi:CDP-diacylglycerol--glycerol-3-phosphate 3-phosphatidyltransferase